MRQMRKIVDKHINTMTVGISHICEGRGKTEQVMQRQGTWEGNHTSKVEDYNIGDDTYAGWD